MVKQETPEISAASLIAAYMTYCLENGQAPTSVYQFCKMPEVEEAEFYRYFGTLKALEKAVWHSFFDQTAERIHQVKEFETYTPREKWLSFFYTFFELLTLNRSYVQMALGSPYKPLESLEQLSGLRRRILELGAEWSESGYSMPESRLMRANSRLKNEGIWLQTLFLLRFWLRDESAGFQKTDMAIEKSIQTYFDLADAAPVERLFDFGKFLYKEHFGHTA